jgi:hypothetical protein
MSDTIDHSSDHINSAGVGAEQCLPLVTDGGTRHVRLSASTRTKSRVNFNLEPTLTRTSPTDEPPKDIVSIGNHGGQQIMVSGAVGRTFGSTAVGGRYHMQPRRSLLGKPINYRAHKRDAKYRRLQNKIYNFLERPKDYRSISYHILV